MIASSLLTALALGGVTPALAEDTPTRVFVSPFVARSREATAIASLMPGFLQQQLDAHPELDAIAVGEVGPVYDTSAELYLSSCPAGEQTGCAFVVAEVARAELALTGTVDTVDGASRVEVVIIDVLESREVLSFQADLAVGDDVVFAEGVARVLVAVVRGEAGRSDDIRAFDDPTADDTEAQRQAEIAAQLDQLSAEIGDVTTVSSRSQIEIERPRYTASDLAEKMEEEGVKPWERLDMGPREYLRYKNSDLTLAKWRQRAQGRQGQLLVRAGLGLGTGPTHGEYYGVYARSDQNLNVVEAYSYQAVTSGSGFGASGSVSYGLLPFLEVGVLAGTSSGRYGVLIDSYVVGDEHTLGDPEDRSNQALFFGPQVLGSLMPTSVVRPVVGLEFTALLGTAVGSRYELPVPELSGFSSPLLFQAGGRVGAEVRVAEQLDLFLHLPVGLVIAGKSSDSARVGSDGLDTQDILDPPAMSPISAGLNVGVQIRLGGKKTDGGGVMDSELL